MMSGVKNKHHLRVDVTVAYSIIVLSAFAVSCDDNFRENIEHINKSASENKGPNEHIVPNPGNNGIITASDITASGVILEWVSATDAKTPREKL